MGRRGAISVPHLEHHVVLDVVEEVEHPLAQAIRRTEVLGGGQRFGRLLGEPRGGELALDVFAVEEVAEDELVPEGSGEGMGAMRWEGHVTEGVAEEELWWPWYFVIEFFERTSESGHSTL